jgi:hypothetical protein
MIFPSSQLQVSAACLGPASICLGVTLEHLSVHRPCYHLSRGKKTPFRLPFQSLIRSAKKLQKVTLIRNRLSPNRIHPGTIQTALLSSLLSAPLSKCALHLGRGRRRGIRFSFRFSNNETCPRLHPEWAKGTPNSDYLFPKYLIT